MQKFGGLGRLRVTQGHQQHSHSTERIQLLFDFNRNYACILYCFRVIAHFLSKVANFNPLHLPGLSSGNCVILRLAILIQYWSVTDRQTHDDGIYRAGIASHGKNRASCPSLSKQLRKIKGKQTKGIFDLGIWMRIGLRSGDAPIV